MPDKAAFVSAVLLRVQCYRANHYFYHTSWFCIYCWPWNNIWIQKCNLDHFPTPKPNLTHESSLKSEERIDEWHWCKQQTLIVTVNFTTIINLFFKSDWLITMLFQGQQRCWSKNMSHLVKSGSAFLPLQKQHLVAKNEFTFSFRPTRKDQQVGGQYANVSYWCQHETAWDSF